MKMKLYCSATSPYSRKVRIALRELQLTDQTDEIIVDPFNPPADFLAANPLSKIPALVTAGGEALPDSRLIIEYLWTRHPRLPPLPPGAEHWRARRRQQLAEGMIDAAVARQIEKRKPEPYIYPVWLERQLTIVVRTLDVLEGEVAHLHPEELSPVELGAGVALSYLDFRIPELDWRSTHERLARWHEGFARRPSVLATQPPAAAPAPKI